MKSQHITMSLVSLFTLSMFAFAGCQGTPTENTSTTTPSTSGATTAAEVKTPSGAKNINKNTLAGVDTVTYMVVATTKVACEDQSKMVMEAGWKATALTPSLLEVMGSWTQTYENSTKNLVLTCTANPQTSGESMVTMSITDKIAQ